MNYLWDLLIKAEHAGWNKRDIQFALATEYSPYMELSNKTLNSQTIERNVEVNPYYRYYEIFKELFHPENEEEEELRNTLFDIILHFLADVDRLQGMNKREYYVRFLLRDIASNVFGQNAKDKLHLLTKQEQEMIALNMLKLYETGEEIYVLKDTMKKLFKNCVMYLKTDERDEVLIYIGQVASTRNRFVVDLILEIFLPIHFQSEIYWEHHFGIIDVKETMRLDYIALY